MRYVPERMKVGGTFLDQAMLVSERYVSVACVAGSVVRQEGFRPPASHNSY